MDEFWVKAMKEELEQYECNDVWTLIPKQIRPMLLAPNGFTRIKQMKLVI